MKAFGSVTRTTSSILPYPKPCPKAWPLFPFLSYHSRTSTLVGMLLMCVLRIGGKIVMYCFLPLEANERVFIPCELIIPEVHQASKSMGSSKISRNPRSRLANRGKTRRALSSTYLPFTSPQRKLIIGLAVTLILLRTHPRLLNYQERNPILKCQELDTYENLSCLSAGS